MTRRGPRGAALTGVGLATTLDEVVFHQLLGWHHLVSSGDDAVALASDGVLHVLGTAALVAGVYLLVRHWRGDRRGAVAGVLVGLGGFNVFDGIVDHKLLRLHQVREGVPDLLPYDVTWLAVSLAVLAAGLLLRRRATGTAPQVV